MESGVSSLKHIPSCVIIPWMERIQLYSFIGPEGSGKTEQAKLLASKLGFLYVSTGDMIRDAKENDQTYLGDACREMARKGVYLEASLLLEIVSKRLQRQDAENGVILDGGFRTVEETENFENALKNVGRSFNVKVFFIWTPILECYKRQIKRGRGDDTPEKIKSRMKSFYSGLDRRMNFIRDNWSLVIIPAGIKSIPEVSQEILEKIT